MYTEVNFCSITRSRSINYQEFHPDYEGAINHYFMLAFLSFLHYNSKSNLLVEGRKWLTILKPQEVKLFASDIQIPSMYP